MKNRSNLLLSTSLSLDPLPLMITASWINFHRHLTADGHGTRWRLEQEGAMRPQGPSP